LRTGGEAVFLLAPAFKVVAPVLAVGAAATTLYFVGVNAGKLKCQGATARAALADTLRQDRTYDAARTSYRDALARALADQRTAQTQLDAEVFPDVAPYPDSDCVIGNDGLHGPRIR
jgi:hypothetical protein